MLLGWGVWVVYVGLDGALSGIGYWMGWVVRLGGMGCWVGWGIGWDRI